MPSACTPESPGAQPADARPAEPRVVARLTPGGEPVRLERVGGARTWWLRDTDASALVAPERHVLGSASEWAAFYTRAFPWPEVRASVPRVDFAREAVVVVAPGTVANGTRVRIAGATTRRDTLVVLVHTSTNVYPDCRLDGVLTPVVAARAPRAGWHTVVFRDSTDGYDCTPDGPPRGS